MAKQIQNLQTQQRLKANFNKAANSYLDHAIIQQKPALLLIDKFRQYHTSGRVLDLGSGPGTFSHGKCQLPDNLVNADLSLNMLKQSICNHNDLVCADVTNLPFANSAYSIVISSLMLQWLDDKNKGFAELSRVIKSDGHLLFTTLINPSLWQLDLAYKQIDSDEHIRHFCSEDDYFKLCRSNGFEVLESIIWSDDYEFASMLELFRHFRLTGTTLPQKSQQRGIGGKERLAKLAINYPDMRDGGKFRLSYYYLLIVARKTYE
ncbi:MAG: methyltransferase domain-containing protein [Neisseriales bacterium]|nr:MAG: methyltransferase domain-containing protein [Neisseriales bacterium]